MESEERLSEAEVQRGLRILKRRIVDWPFVWPFSFKGNVCKRITGGLILSLQSKLLILFYSTVSAA